MLLDTKFECECGNDTFHFMLDRVRCEACGTQYRATHKDVYIKRSDNDDWELM